MVNAKLTDAVEPHSVRRWVRHLGLNRACAGRIQQRQTALLIQAFRRRLGLAPAQNGCLRQVSIEPARGPSTTADVSGRASRGSNRLRQCWLRKSYFASNALIARGISNSGRKGRTTSARPNQRHGALVLRVVTTRPGSSISSLRPAQPRAKRPWLNWLIFQAAGECFYDAVASRAVSRFTGGDDPNETRIG